MILAVDSAIIPLFGAPRPWSLKSSKMNQRG